jgi:hypothetical protein
MTSVPQWPMLRAVATCAESIKNDDGTWTLKGVSSGFFMKQHATVHTPADVSFDVFVELFADDFEPAPGEKLRIEGRDRNGRVLGEFPTQAAAFGPGTKVVTHRSRVELWAGEAQIILLRVSWGNRRLIDVPVVIAEAGSAPDVTKGRESRITFPKPGQN